MQRVCCGCQKYMGESSQHFPDQAGEQALVTHGLCDECARRIYGKLAEMVLTGEATLVTGKGKKRSAIKRGIVGGHMPASVRVEPASPASFHSDNRLESRDQFPLEMERTE